MSKIPNRVRIPRRSLAAWDRVRTKIKNDLREVRPSGDLSEIPDSEVVALMIDRFDQIIRSDLCITSSSSGTHLETFEPTYEWLPDDYEPPEQPEWLAKEMRLEWTEEEVSLLFEEEIYKMKRCLADMIKNVRGQEELLKLLRPKGDGEGT